MLAFHQGAGTFDGMSGQKGAAAAIIITAGLGHGPGSLSEASQRAARARGLPVIGTTASGASEIIADGETGFVIEPGNLEQLVERLQAFIARPQLARQMREQAITRRASLGWSAYGDRWSRILHELN